jgi:hypothetical protein
VIEQRASSNYAPFFGLDIQNIRRWVEIQFSDGMGWEDFGKKWQFDHILPVACFDFNKHEDLVLCWNFLNIRIVSHGTFKKKVDPFDILASRISLNLSLKTPVFPVCKKFLEKIDQLEAYKWISSGHQQSFISEKKDFLEDIIGFGPFEFDLLNAGKTPDEVKKEG